MFDRIRAMLVAGTWEELHRVVAEHPMLASDATDALIGAWLDQEADEAPALIAAVRRTRFVLARCRTIGIDTAFADFIANTLPLKGSGEHPLSLPIGVILRCVGDAYDTAPETLPAFKDSIEPLLSEGGTLADAGTRALLWWCLGLCHHKLPTGDLQENLVAAVRYITAFASASTHGRQPFPLQVLSASLADLVLAIRPDFRLDNVNEWIATLGQAADVLPLIDEAAQRDIMLLQAVAFLQAGGTPRIGHIEAAVALLEQVVGESGRIDRPEHRARAQNLLGEALRLPAFVGIGSRLQRAVELFAIVEEAHKAGKLDDTMLNGFLFRVRVRTNLALALTQRLRDRGASDGETAVALLRGNLQALSARGIEAGRSQIARHLARAYGWENFAEPLAALRLGLRYCSRRDDPTEWAEMHAECGRFYGRVPSGGNVERAIRHLEQALEVYTPHEHEHRWAQVQIALGRAYSNRAVGVRECNLDEATRCLRAALKIEDPAGDYERNRARSLGDVLFLAERWAEAHEAYRRAIDAGLFVLARAQSGDAIRAELGTLTSLSARSAFCLLRLGRPADALLEVEEGRTRILARGLDPEPPLAELAEVERERLAQARATLAEVAFERESLFEGIPWRRSEPALSAAHKAGALAVAELVRPRRAPIYAPGSSLKHQDILALVPKDGALVVPLVTEGGSVAWVIPADAKAITAAHVLPLGDATARQLELALRGTGEDYFGWLRAYFQRPPVIVAGSEPGVPQELWTDLLWHFSGQIWAALMGPIHERLGSHGLGRGACIVFVATSELCMLPLAAAADSMRSFVDDYALAVVPSLLSLHVACENGRQAAAEKPRLLAVLDPRDDLPFAALEGRVLAQQAEKLPVTVLASAEATRDEVTRLVPDHSLLHFACHGVFELDDPLRSRLQLAGGTQLALKELITERLLKRVQLAVLSACDTAITDVERAPEESTGFPLGLIQAGAAAVVSALWEVNDLSTMLLVEQFYARFFDGRRRPCVRRSFGCAISPLARWRSASARRGSVSTVGRRTTPRRGRGVASQRWSPSAGLSNTPTSGRPSYSPARPDLARQARYSQ